MLCLLILTSPLSIHANSLIRTEAGISAYQYHYEEPGLMAIQGLLFDVNTALAIQRPQDRLPIIRAEGRYFLSDDPTYTSENTGTSYRNYHTGFETRLLLGQKLYAGIGYRELVHHGEGTVSSTGHIGYDRRSQYTYIPIGIRFTLNTTNNRPWTINIEYRNLQHGMQTSRLKKGTSLGTSSVNYYTLPDDKDFKNNQPNGYGVHVAIKSMKQLPHRIIPKDNQFKINALATTIFFNYWNIDDSDFVRVNQSLVLYEPRNYTTELGIALHLIF